MMEPQWPFQSIVIRFSSHQFGRGASFVLAFVVSACSSFQTDRSLKPEAAWNEAGIWQRVSDKPPTYVPTGYAATRPRGEHDGLWITDRRDGKRFFVPHEPVRGTSPGVLLGEACKITDYQAPKEPKSMKRVASDAASAAFLTVLTLGAGMADTKLLPTD
jgi:hypothetical protein